MAKAESHNHQKEEVKNANSTTSKADITTSTYLAAFLLLTLASIILLTQYQPWSPFGWFKGPETKIEVTSNPPDAWIFVDNMGDQRGRTPQTISVTPGQHTIIILQTGYEKYTQDININKGETQTINAELKPIEGYPTPTTLSQEEIETHKPQTTTTLEQGIPPEQQQTTTTLEQQTGPEQETTTTIPSIVGAVTPTFKPQTLSIIESVPEPRILGYIVEFNEEPVLATRARILKDIDKKTNRLETERLTTTQEVSLKDEISTLKTQAAAQALSQKNRVDKEQENGLKALQERIPKLKDLKNIKHRFRTILNGVSLNITAEEAEGLKKLPEVKAVYPNYEVQAMLMDSVPLIRANHVWNMDSDMSNCTKTGKECLTGKGITIGIIDTGVDYTHPDLGGCFGPGCKVVGGFDFVNNDSDPMDDAGHGTHCAAIAAGNGTLMGVAPDARIYAFKVLDKYGSGSFSTVITAIERSYDLNGDGKIYGIDPEENNPEDVLDVISLSLGASCLVSVYYPKDCGPDDLVSRAIDTAVDNGVVAVVAAGNEGKYVSSISSPGTARKAITVGASMNTRQGEGGGRRDIRVAEFSSRGFVKVPGDLIVKPDVVAPGYNICAAEWDDFASDKKCLDQRHIAISGTSMATPHVAGAAALLKQAHIGWSPKEIKMALMQTAFDLNDTLYIQGRGRIDVLKAVNVSKFAMEDCEVPGDEDGDKLADCADYEDDCPFGIPCNRDHTLFCNSQQRCTAPEDCTKPGDEDGNGIADCNDTSSCPDFTFCSNDHKNQCFNSNCIKIPDIITLAGTEDITNLSTLMHRPVVSGNVTAWFRGFPGYGTQLVIHNLATGSERTIKLRSEYPTDDIDFNSIDMSGERIIWSGVSGSHLGDQGEVHYDYDIFVYNISTGNMTILRYPGLQGEPAISGDLIAWIDGQEDNTSGIYLYDLKTQQRTRIDSAVGSAYVAYSLRISGNRVLWERIITDAEGYWKAIETRVYDVKTNRTTVEMTDFMDWVDGLTISFNEPDITSDKIVYIFENRSHFASYPRQLHMYNLKTKKAINLTDWRKPPLVKGGLRVSKNNAVWKAYVFNQSVWEIYYDPQEYVFTKDLCSGEDNILTGRDTDLYYPYLDIGDKWIVWLGIGLNGEWIHAYNIKSKNLCFENCSKEGDDDFDGLADCADTVNCPAGTPCDPTGKFKCQADICCCQADFNGDGNIDNLDLAQLDVCFSGSNIQYRNPYGIDCNKTDLDGDQDVDQVDVSKFSLCYPDWNKVNKFGLVAYYPFENSAADNSGSGNNGVNYGAAFVNGKVGRAASFDGVNDNITVPNSKSLQIDGNLTLMFWIRPENMGSARINPIEKAFWGEFALTIWNNDSSIIYYHGRNWTNGRYWHWRAFWPGAIANNRWDHLAITRDASTNTTKSYLNGALYQTGVYSLTTEGYPANPSKSTNPLTMGIGYTQVPYKGLLDEVKLYNRVLNPEEICTEAGNYWWPDNTCKTTPPATTTTSTTTTTTIIPAPKIESCKANTSTAYNGSYVSITASITNQSTPLDNFWFTLNETTAAKQKAINATNKIVWKTDRIGNFSVKCWVNDTKGLTNSITDDWLAIIKPPPGNLNVTSSPTNASLYVDNLYRGLTPKIVTNLPVGYHPTTVSKTGYITYSSSVYIQAGKTINLKVYLSSSTIILTTIYPMGFGASTNYGSESRYWSMIPTLLLVMYFVYYYHQSRRSSVNVEPQ